MSVNFNQAVRDSNAIMELLGPGTVTKKQVNQAEKNLVTLIVKVENFINLKTISGSEENTLKNTIALIGDIIENSKKTATESSFVERHKYTLAKAVGAVAGLGLAYLYDPMGVIVVGGSYISTKLPILKNKHPEFFGLAYGAVCYPCLTGATVVAYTANKLVSYCKSFRQTAPKVAIRPIQLVQPKPQAKREKIEHKEKMFIERVGNVDSEASSTLGKIQVVKVPGQHDQLKPGTKRSPATTFHALEACKNIGQNSDAFSTQIAISDAALLNLQQSSRSRGGLSEPKPKKEVSFAWDPVYFIDQNYSQDKILSRMSYKKTVILENIREKFGETEFNKELSKIESNLKKPSKTSKKRIDRNLKFTKQSRRAKILYQRAHKEEVVDSWYDHYNNSENDTRESLRVLEVVKRR